MPGGLHPPISVLLTWRPNYLDPETRYMTFICFVAALLGITYLVVLLRLWARFKLANSAGLDDLLIIFNMFPLTGLAISLYRGFTQYGFDKHIWDSRPETLMGARKVVMLLEFLYMLSTCMTKISILLFYRRLAIGTISNRFLYIIYAAIAFVIAYFITFNLTLFLHCRPFSAYWKQVNLRWYLKHKGTATRKADFYCNDESIDLIVSAVISILQDFMAVGIPMVLFWKLRVNWKEKLALSIVFGIGIFVGICGILRLIYIRKIYYHTYDMTWESYWAWVWFAVEAHFAVICASAPALKTFFKHTFEETTNHFKLGHKKTLSDVEAGRPWLERTVEQPGATYSQGRDYKWGSASSTKVAEKEKELPPTPWEPKEGAFF